MATNNTLEISQNGASDVLKRCAIDPAGRLGSLYDGYRDCVLGQLDVKSTDKVYESLRSTKCRIVKGEASRRPNLSRLSRMEDELQLSILLNLTPKTGMASLMDYSGTIYDYTRILFFHYVKDEEQLSGDLHGVRQYIRALMPQASVTHIVIGVSWGIHLAVFLQLPYEAEFVKKIDDLLEKIQFTLESGQSNLTLNTDDENILRTIINTKIYSNVPNLTRMATLCDVCRYINDFKDGPMNYPITYTLQSITWLCSEYPKQSAKFFSMSSGFVDYIVKHLLQLSSAVKSLEVTLNGNSLKLLSAYLKGQLYDAHQQWLDVNKKYMNEIERLSKLIISCRSRGVEMQAIKNAIEDNEHAILQKCITDLTRNLSSLEAKGRLISELQPFKYYNVAEHGINENDTIATIERKLIMDEQRDRVLCTDDVLNKKNSEKLNQLRCKLLQDYNENPDLRLIHADFSYTSYQLYDMIILPSTKTTNNKIQKKQEDTSSVVKSQSATPDTVNILLLGETGVGKSTFINALVNYLTFDSLKTAESNKPVVLIPVSFIITTGDNFEEHTIELDSIYKPDTENFNLFGQSVTQHCKSYILRLKDGNGKKLRIIDTPGFGDTRGIEQDDRNMQCILEYINKLTHLNAICFLLKPNTEKLNMYFRLCITQLLDHLGPNARENIIFCFTNTRATFFAPGNTGPQLKSMLNLLSMGNILFEKRNTFCFDSESFRYLVAVQKNFPPVGLDKSEYERSWSVSMKESNRLIDYIYNDLNTYYMQNERQSMKNIHFDIIHMIRPILEALRNSLRNIVLWSSDLQHDSIQLHSKSIYRLATQCTDCRLKPNLVGKFWIVPDFAHEIQNKCLSCPCAPEKHFPIEYMLYFKWSTNQSNFDEMNDTLQSLFNATVEIAYFLKHVAHSTEDDPFLIGLNRMIDEEKYITQNVESNELNLQLIQQLENLLHDYIRRINDTQPNQSNTDLSTYYNRIKMIGELPMVYEQMAAIKQTQEIMMKHHEFEC